MNGSISFIVRIRYSGEVLKAIRKFEKVDYKLRMAKLDISFLVKYQNENIIPNFLKFRLANKNLQNSVSYRKCQQSLLQTEIDNKKSHLRTFQMNPIVCVSSYNLDLTRSILLIFPLSFLVVMIIF